MNERDNKEILENPLNEEQASVGKNTPEVGEVDVFEMNQAEKNETLQEYPVNEAYKGPEPELVDEDKDLQNTKDAPKLDEANRIDEGDADGLKANNPEQEDVVPLKAEEELQDVEEEEASVGENTDEVGEVDVFEMNQAEKTETLQEYPVNQPYDGPEPGLVDEDRDLHNTKHSEKLDEASDVDAGDHKGLEN